MTTDLRSLFGHAHFATAADAELLARYVAERDDLAFAELVHRHAPAVYAACRRFVSNPADVDDAFQAVFVLLSQKANTLADPAKLSGWLCGAAGRIARKVRSRSARHSPDETPLEEIAASPAPERSADLKAVLDEEFSRLPPAYLEVVTLCDVDGVSRRTAAKRLGVPESTLSNRLTRARAMLGGRLLRRGVALGAGVSLSAVTVAAVPPKLVPLTVSRIAAESVPPNIVTLAAEGTPLMPPLKVVSLLLAGLLFAAAAGFVSLAAQEPVKAPPPAAKKPVEPADPEPEDGGYVIKTAFSRDGRWLAVSEMKHHDGPGDDRITLYDTATWKAVHRIKRDGEKERAWALAFSADGKTLYAGGNGRVHAWDTKTGKGTAEFETDADRCLGLAVSPDGKRLVSAHPTPIDQKGKPAAVLHVWDTANGKKERTVPAEEVSTWAMTGVSFSPDGKTVLVGRVPGDGVKLVAEGFNGLVEIDVATGKEVNRVPTPAVAGGFTPIIRVAAFTPDGKWLIAAGGGVKVTPANGWDSVGYLWVIDRKTGEVEKTLLEKVSKENVGHIALSADGKRLYAAAQSPPQRVLRKGEFELTVLCVLHCWDTSTWDTAWSRPGANTLPNEVAVSPDGKRVAFADMHDGLFLFDGGSGEPKGGLVKLPPRK